MLLMGSWDLVIGNWDLTGFWGLGIWDLPSALGLGIWSFRQLRIIRALLKLALMDNDAPILDYASPRKRVRLRLPARSTIRVRSDQDEVVIVETLQGQAGAVGAIIFACFTLLGLAASLAPVKGQHYHLLEVILVSLLAGAEIALVFAVAHQTWRKTTLTVRFAEMLLAFTSPLHRKHYRWVGDDIADILVVETANIETPAALAELLITRCRGGDIHLFTDHFANEVRPLAAVLIVMFRRGEQAELPAAPLPVEAMPRAPLAALPKRKDLAAYPTTRR